MRRSTWFLCSCKQQPVATVDWLMFFWIKTAKMNYLEGRILYLHLQNHLHCKSGSPSACPAVQSGQRGTHLLTSSGHKIKENEISGNKSVEHLKELYTKISLLEFRKNVCESSLLPSCWNGWPARLLQLRQ